MLLSHVLYAPGVLKVTLICSTLVGFHTKCGWQLTFGLCCRTLHDSGINHFLDFAGTVKGRKRRRGGRHVIWMGIVWVLWMTRNNIILEKDHPVM